MQNEDEMVRYLKRLLATYRLVNSEKIDEKKEQILQNEKRWKIYSLCDEARSVKQIAAKLGTKPQNVNYHLNYLAEMGLLDVGIKDNERFFYQIL